MRYRRMDMPGAKYFFTVNLAERQKSLLVEHVVELRAAMRRVKQNHPFEIDAIVILPDHLHTIWSLPENDADFSLRWNLIKGAFSRKLPRVERVIASRNRKGERGIWQRRFWEHLIRDERDFERHVNYIHYNPVKHGYVSSPCEWEFSSIHRYIALGIIPPDWAGENADTNVVGWGEVRTPTWQTVND